MVLRPQNKKIADSSTDMVILLENTDPGTNAGSESCSLMTHDLFQKNTLKIYFAGSIRGGREFVRVYETIVKTLENFGHFVLTKHVADGSLSAETDHSDPVDVYSRDMKWLRAADLVVAEVTVPSLGVGYELGMATSLRKPTLCLYHESKDLSALSNLIRGVREPEFSVRLYESDTQVEIIISEFLESCSADKAETPPK